MSCFTFLAKELNLFSRDASELTRADVVATYAFLFMTIYLTGWYSYKYFDLMAQNVRTCDSGGNYTSGACIKHELIHTGVLYTGVLNGFLIALFRGLNMAALCINYACCCSYCCSQENNPNTAVRSEIQIEMNRATDPVRVV
jgi:hypothetical protein